MPVDQLKHSAKLQTISPQINEVSTLRFELPLKFKPGQSVAVTFPGDIKKRYYSISSSPTEGPYIEITVKGETGSALAKTLAGLVSGDHLTVEGPLDSSLSLPDPVTESLAFIGAGTGVTPFRSMIKSLLDNKTNADLYLLHSVRSRQNILFENDFLGWAAENKRFRYIPTITKDFDATWKMETGRINEVLIRKHVTAHPCTFMLCGPGGFVTDMETLLKETLHVPQERIRREKW